MSSLFRRLLVALGVTAAALVALVVAWGIDLRAHDGQVARNVSLAGRSVGGLTRDELQEVVASLAARYDDAEVRVREQGKDKTAFTTTTEALAVDLDPQRTIASAMQTGRDGSVLRRVWSWLLSPLSPRHARVKVSIDEHTFREAIASQDPGPRTPPVEPSVTFKDGAFVAVEGKPGRGLDPADLRRALERRASNGVPITLTVRRGTIPPRFGQEDARRLAGLAQGRISSSLEASAGRTSARLPLSTVRTWVTAEAGAASLELALDDKRVLADLEEHLPNAGDPPVDAKFNVVGGAVTITAGKNGERCCAPEAAALVERAILAGASSVTDLPLRVEPPELTLAKARELNINEPVGSFTTNHPSGQSRVINIHRIADIVRGTVIQPGDTFSINTTVGRRTTAKGFVAGGVIEDGRFAEDIGGGVSQFATTLFNAAFFAGLEIPEYQAHTIYISRYPYGREATMSYPQPDLKIKNTSPHGVLIWPTYTDTSITVTLYSTKWVTAEQTAQSTAPSGNCTRVTTTRTRTWSDGRTETDKFFARYQPEEGVNC